MVPLPLLVCRGIAAGNGAKAAALSRARAVRARGLSDSGIVDTGDFDADTGIGTGSVKGTDSDANASIGASVGEVALEVW